jgi:hypothetical protein
MHKLHRRSIGTEIDLAAWGSRVTSSQGMPATDRVHAANMRPKGRMS